MSNNPDSAETLLTGYNHELFDALEGPDEAFNVVKSLNGENVIDTTIWDLFVRHDMWDKFGITLLHRHFNMAPSEKLVSVDNTSVP
ncbi:hypothetical protein CVT25_000790 [Psilocybe cyanescens]|uniref:Uncharacterized protein n=1 Tax=Psilocybe cyanescens TaxID=93625 RepID=A0A409XM91_PSICY|nr:hypothetical protein CVT25_000790 [Psilocybe cyanescens]